MARLREFRVFWSVALGIGLGLGIVLFDIVAESRLQSGTLTGALAPLHAVIDHSFPVLAGGLLGLCLYQLRLRARLRLAEEAAQRAEALRERLQKVERDQAVWVLAAAVLHELNNPLHALGLLLDELETCDSDAKRRVELERRARTQIGRALAHLATLRSMHGSAEPECRSIAIDPIARALAEDVQPLAASSGIRVSVACAEALAARADPTYVRTILENLLDNSLQALATGSGRTVSIELVREAERAVVRIADDGPALAPELRPVIFDPLRTTKAHGLGLGLPIARALARAMRGELRLEDGEHKAFRLELPLAESP